MPVGTVPALTGVGTGSGHHNAVALIRRDWHLVIAWLSAVEPRVARVGV